MYWSTSAKSGVLPLKKRPWSLKHFFNKPVTWYCSLSFWTQRTVTLTINIFCLRSHTWGLVPSLAEIWCRATHNRYEAMQPVDNRTDHKARTPPGHKKTLPRKSAKPKPSTPKHRLIPLTRKLGTQPQTHPSFAKKCMLMKEYEPRQRCPTHFQVRGSSQLLCKTTESRRPG